MEKGAFIPNPFSIYVGEEVNIDLISGDKVEIYPGCRILGEKTVISKGVKLGYEAPVTLEDCQLGAHVELKGGFFKKSVFLEKSHMGSGAHVREACILEEEASGAHCVGLKQTILFPFVTLGSLINFCDCLMAGGTSRRNHSEVGSSYIHFNFTPEGDKATPSLIGDVPRGVMLDKPRIFLGGQGGMVGPVRIGFRNVVAAGSIIRKDYPFENKLILASLSSDIVRDMPKRNVFSLNRIIKNNIIYISNLIALEDWYIHVRQPFLKRTEFGDFIYNGLIDKIHLSIEERLKRLKELLEKYREQKPEFFNKFEILKEVIKNKEQIKEGIKERDKFINTLNMHITNSKLNYIEFIKNLNEETKQYGTDWLYRIINNICENVEMILPALAPILK
ncbi:MAG TPA: hypothetical protein PLM71_05260 [Syntrophorhabdaceae bacterium]|nr:hypothetical protein [Syntrophorhabdaceae bacterium]